ncbi:M15 family metallopeptidase [Paenibacillus protaetiae]|uniref:D-alanyl-D-alanine carboxypeptidase family protein n=1 Tax=Paenibacillus protaetiae TaxID=2509456 RepID=A0A4P6F0H8_9BACL|nr:M15 family metallopeptidase [Paenibacillus protaetiae]QAY66497.1 D-alanyl-D-alanine carboxypeptidase family protein [Paenibacillus protaetiae]
MKKRFFWLFSVVCIGAVMFALWGGKGEGAITGVSIQKNAAPAGGKPVKSVELSLDHIYEGNLILVNKDYPVHEEGIPDDIVQLSEHPDLMQGYGLLDSSIRISASLLPPFNEMIKAAGEDGVRHYIISSGYRGLDEQEELYKEKGGDYALPAGYSEHNVGLSLDIGSSLTAMDHAPEGKWLKQNAWKYGFILRYPADKTNITGIQYEPWHFRYVGLPHSAIMKKLDLTLEQYVDDLRSKKSLSVTVEGVHYTVSYYRLTKANHTVKLPQDGWYELSGNNVDGVIVTTKS